VLRTELGALVLLRSSSASVLFEDFPSPIIGALQDLTADAHALSWSVTLWSYQLAFDFVGTLDLFSSWRLTKSSTGFCFPAQIAV
jgi:hypothetical protein